MSQAPHVVRGARWGDSGSASRRAFEDLLWAALTDTYCGLSMAQTAEKLADKYGVTREEADESPRVAAAGEAAWDEGRFEAEVEPITGRTRKGEVLFNADEHMRPDTTLEALGALRPYFRKDGLVTAGNASGIGDGAAAVVIAARSGRSARGSRRSAGSCPGASRASIRRHHGDRPGAGRAQGAGQGGAAARRDGPRRHQRGVRAAVRGGRAELGARPEKTNVNGGAIAITHPLAASGARITVNLLHELRRRGGRYALGQRLHRRWPGHGRGGREWSRGAAFRRRAEPSATEGGLVIDGSFRSAVWRPWPLVTSLRVLREYERGVVFRLGRLVGPRGPASSSCCRSASSGW
jgi:acetyl-CoA acyltransferase 2